MELRKISIALLFYKKICMPALIISVVAGTFNAVMLGFQAFDSTGAIYLFLAPVFHLLLYDIMHPREYYFYNNIGLGRLTLWIISLLLTLTISLTITLAL